MGIMEIITDIMEKAMDTTRVIILQFILKIIAKTIAAGALKRKHTIQTHHRSTSKSYCMNTNMKRKCSKQKKTSCPMRCKW